MKLTVDLVIRRGKDFLFVRRGAEPFKGTLAFPGGFVDDDDVTVEAGAVRELEEETALRIRENQLRLLGVFSKLGRDPRGRTATIAYLCDVPARTEARAGDDAAEVVWLTAEEAAKEGLAFDHADILAAAEKFKE